MFVFGIGRFGDLYQAGDSQHERRLLGFRIWPGSAFTTSIPMLHGSHEDRRIPLCVPESARSCIAGLGDSSRGVALVVRFMAVVCRRKHDECTTEAKL
eukprot:4945572-Amphidinium_carterae.4